MQPVLALCVRHASVHCMTSDRPLLGILLMLGFCTLAPIGDAIAKVLGASIPLGELLLVRFALQAIILVPVVILTRRTWHMDGWLLRMILIRTLLHIAGIGSMFTALMYLPLADAVAIAFVMPFIMLILGKYILNEEVGLRRVIACLVGFIGTLLVIQPSFVDVGLPALWPLAVAVLFSFFILTTRQIAHKTDPVTLQAVSGVIACAFIAPAIWVGQLFGFEPLTMIAPNAVEWSLLLTIGILGTGAHLLMTWSLRFAPAATLAPMQYLEIPIATGIGWLVFSDLPNNTAAVGISITMSAGLYIIMREQVTARAKARSRPADQALQAPG
jgi:drug/metabolite transporter (DMT)-like permease